MRVDLPTAPGVIGAIVATMLFWPSGAAATTVGPEVPLTLGGLQLPWYPYPGSDVACGVHNCLVARTNADTVRGAGVVFARVDASTGTLLDPGERWVGRGSLVGVACVGDDCTIAMGFAVPAVMPINELRLAHVSAATGAVSGTSAPDVAASWGLIPTGIDCGTSRCLTVWLEGTNTGAETVRAALVDPATSLPLEPGGFVVSPAGSNMPPTVGCEGNRCIVEWATNGTSRSLFRRIDLTTGAVVDPVDVDLGVSLSFAPPMACSSGICVFLSEDFVSPNSILRATRVRLSDAAVLDATPVTLEIASLPMMYDTMSCSGSTCALIWSRYSDGNVFLARWNIETATIMDASPILVSAFGGSSDVVTCSGSSCLAAWRDLRGGTDYESFGARIDLTTGSVADPDGIAIGTNAMIPGLGCIGRRCVATWQQIDQFPGAGGFTVYGTPLDPTTADVRLASPALLVHVGPMHHASFACGSGDLCLLGSDDGQGRVGAGRVDVATAASRDSFPTALMPSAAEAARTSTACVGTACLSAWQQTGADGDLDIVGVRVDLSSGAVVDGPFVIERAPGDQVAPTLACGSSRCAIAWQDGRSSDWDLYGTRFDPATDARIDAGDIALSTATGMQSAPRLACDDDICLVVWQDARNATDEDVYAARWHLSSGAVDDIDGFALAGGSTRQQLPSVSCAGGRCLVAWQDLGAGLSNVFGERIDLASGAIIDVPAASLVPDQTGSRGPALVTWDVDRALLSYYRRDAMPATHIYARTVTSNLPTGAACDQGLACSSGRCVAGTCAESLFPIRDAGIVDAFGGDATSPDSGAGEDTTDVDAATRAPSRSCACATAASRSNRSPGLGLGLAVLTAVLAVRRRRGRAMRSSRFRSSR